MAGPEDVREKAALRQRQRPGLRVTIGAKLTLATLVVVVAVSVFLYRELTRRERQSLLAAKTTAASMVADLFAASLSAPLDFADQESIATELGHLEKNPEVRCAAVFLKEEVRPVRSLERGCDASAPVDANALEGVIVRPDRVEVARLVLGRDKVVGRTRIVLSLDRENAAFAASQERIFWLTFLLASGTAAVLVLFSRTQIVSPLRRLAEAARRVGKGELATRVDAGRGDELGDLATAFNRMSEAIGDRERKLAAATQNLRDLFDNMAQAIVAFDREGKIRGPASRTAAKLLGAALEGRSIEDVLFGGSRGAPGTDIEGQAFLEWRKAVFDVGARGESWASFADLAPKEVVLRRGSAEIPLVLEFRPVDKDGSLERVMVLATDVSEQRRLEAQVATQEERHAKRTAAMRRLIAGGTELFVRFIEGARARIATAFEHFADGVEVDLPRIEDLFRHVHTMKGEARAFDLAELADALESLEDTLAALRKNAAALADRELAEEAASAIRTGLFSAEAAIERARADFVAVSPIGNAALEQATVQRADLEAALALAGSATTTRGDRDALAAAVERLGARPFGEALATIAERLPEWADRERKRVALVVEGREVRVPRALASVLQSVLTHLVRNALAHGIEPETARRAAGKEPAGTIWATIDASADPSRPTITVEDDGAGIAAAEVRARAKAMGLDPATEPVDLVFEPGLSTRATSDGLAGRGVGLDAVRGYLAEVGYGVSVITEEGAGTKFVLAPIDDRPDRLAVTS